jgi:hypothetical protein
VVVAAMAPIDWLPVVAVLLVQPPVAAQELALFADQVSVALPPAAMLVGFAVSVRDGCGATVTVAEPLALPPVPVQVME